MKRQPFYFLLFLICISFQDAAAQVNDAQFWENITLEKNITPKLITRIVQEGRVTENLTRPSFNYFDMGFNYKINKHIHLGLAYVWVEKRTLDDFASPRHQVYGDVTFRKKIKNFQINDRQMFLWQVKDYNTSETGKNPDYYLRNKLTIRYDKYFKISPYVAAEIYYRANSTDYVRYRYDRIRTFLGVFYRTNKENEFEAYYLYEKHFNENDPQTNWVIGLGYTHTF